MVLIYEIRLWFLFITLSTYVVSEILGLQYIFQFKKSLLGLFLKNIHKIGKLYEFSKNSIHL